MRPSPGLKIASVLHYCLPIRDHLRFPILDHRRIDMIDSLMMMRAEHQLGVRSQTDVDIVERLEGIHKLLSRHVGAGLSEPVCDDESIDESFQADEARLCARHVFADAFA